jgi:hypothetical protein
MAEEIIDQQTQKRMGNREVRFGEDKKIETRFIASLQQISEIPEFIF